MTIKHYGVVRVISKLGLGSRTQAAEWVSKGRVRVNGRVVQDAEFAVRMELDRVTVDGMTAPMTRLVIMLNKPRGLVTTVSDDRGRDTVYRCFAGAELPWLAPVGRLDKASEGLLLFSNDPMWAAGITDAKAGPDKTYHVQIDCVADVSLLIDLARGVEVDGEFLRAKHVVLLRAGSTNSWLTMTLDEGRNRQIRRLLAAFDISVLRLMRIAIGGLVLGGLQKGAWRELAAAEIDLLKTSR